MTVYSNTGLILVAAIGGIVGGLIALLGLGFSVRKVSQHVYGGGTWGGPALRNNVDWDELDRRANGSLEHDARL